ncbi:MAG: prenyltransferase [Candidatus Nomurabacteria bacterium]
MKDFLKISRPRFWVYVAGPFWLCGAIFYPLGVNITPMLIFLLYFTFPANILIYGINDLYDRATDTLNTKKTSYEQVLDKKYDKKLIWIIILTNIPFLIYGFFVLPTASFICLLLFVVLSWQYSATPLRAKAVPFLDSFVSGLLYIVPAGVSWALITNSYPPFLPMLAGFLWSYSMHLYSAVPDINADKMAGIQTGATLLGKNTTLILCGVLYAVSSLIAYFYIGFFAIIAGLGYLYLIFISIKKSKPEEVLVIYKIFPFLNTLVGGILFAILFFLH